jgi:hypothetical protein
MLSDNSSSVMLYETDMNKKIARASERKNPGTKLNNTRKRKMHEIKKEEKERRLGIFNKAIELSILCQSKTAIIVKDDEIAETLRLQYEALQEKLEEEQDTLEAVKVTEAQKSDFNFHDWWNNSIDDMNLESLEDFKNSLESFKGNLRSASEAEKSNLHPNINIAT